MKFSIILPTFNRKKLLTGCIRSLLDQDYPKREFEILVIDDGSDDSTEKYCRRLIKNNDKIRYFRTENKGPGNARNVGLRNAKGIYIAFTDDDCILAKNWLKMIEDEFNISAVDVVGGSIINPTDRYIARTQYILNFSSWFPKGNKRNVKDIPTANICYKKSAIYNHFFPKNSGNVGYEDSLFNYEICKQKKKILFCPEIRVKHYTWDEDYGLRKFFLIQKKAALGFVSDGYKVHGLIGKILINLRFLNLFCPRLILVFYRCIRYGYFFKFIIHLPLLTVGEFYKGFVIISA